MDPIVWLAIIIGFGDVIGLLFLQQCKGSKIWPVTRICLTILVVIIQVEIDKNTEKMVSSHHDSLLNKMDLAEIENEILQGKIVELRIVLDSAKQQLNNMETALSNVDLLYNPTLQLIEKKSQLNIETATFNGAVQMGNYNTQNN